MRATRCTTWLMWHRVLVVYLNWINRLNSWPCLDGFKILCNKRDNKRTSLCFAPCTPPALLLLLLYMSEERDSTSVSKASDVTHTHTHTDRQTEARRQGLQKRDCVIWLQLSEDAHTNYLSVKLQKFNMVYIAPFTFQHWFLPFIYPIYLSLSAALVRSQNISLMMREKQAKVTVTIGL